MSADRDVDRIVRSWLRTDEHESADEVLGIVLSRLDTTPQRRPWWPARRDPMNNRLTQGAIAAAAVLVLALIGYNLLPVPGVGDKSTAPPTSLPSAVEPTSSPLAMAPQMPNGELDPGTYSIAAYSNTRFEVTVPRGWTYEGGWLTKGDPFRSNGVVFTPSVLSHVYRDRCHWKGTLQETASKDAIVAQLGDQVRQAGNRDTMLGTYPGYPATLLVFDEPSDTDVSLCDDAIMRLWPDVGPDESGGLPISPGQRVSVYVIEDRGKATVLVALTNEDSDPTAVAELQAIVQSIHIPRCLPADGVPTRIDQPNPSPCAF